MSHKFIDQGTIAGVVTGGVTTGGSYMGHDKRVLQGLRQGDPKGYDSAGHTPLTVIARAVSITRFCKIINLKLKPR